MLKTLHLLICSSVVLQGITLDPKLITTIRYGIDRNLKYIYQHSEKMNEDCWFGIVLATAIIRDAYQNGTHVMDNSSMKLTEISQEVLKKGQHKTWLSKSILDPNIWQRNLKYKYNALDPLKKRPSLRILKNIYRYQNLSDEYPNSDFCLQNIVNLTKSLTPVECYINEDCRKKYYEYDRRASAYILTHKLLLLQLARARHCIISDREYETETRKICSLIFGEVISADYFDVLDDMFDLFLEEVLLCGYEGYIDFLKSKWLIYILKSQKKSGCFPASLGDPLKSRIKRDTNILPDGCADHTTGLGAAVLSLYYNFIIKGNVSIKI
ncbi:UPF0764 protein C16orf89 homolog [Anoplophora glabripennis]|uniref:UPF0764 protein C16orf89 homolog n=1 Tax=Anoplophora glabripennis TaxID=217634 RepID=UPI000874F0D7|nr:UPF0764 protein C16orf89 homolog [Anoplophora glabripennis]